VAHGIEARKARNRMRGHRLIAIPVLILAAGCQSAGRQRTIASSEPPLVPSGESGARIVQTEPARTVTWADRHPLFTKPREYYDNSGSNRVVKAAAATVIGVPAGILGELRQIVVGAPQEIRY